MERVARGQDLRQPARFAHGGQPPQPGEAAKISRVVIQEVDGGRPGSERPAKGRPAGSLRLPQTSTGSSPNGRKRRRRGEAVGHGKCPNGRVECVGCADKPLDFLKFQRLFQERLLAGDPETLKLVKDGKMMVTPQQMHHLMEEWEGKSLAAGGAKPKPGETVNNGAAGKSPASDSAAGKVATDKTTTDKDSAGKVAAPGKTPAPPRRPRGEPVPEKAKPEDLAKMRDLMKNAEPLGDGRFRFRGSPDSAQELRSLPGWGAASRAMSYGSRARNYCRTSLRSPPRPARARSSCFATESRPCWAPSSAKTAASSPNSASFTARSRVGSARTSCPPRSSRKGTSMIWPC